RPARRPRTRGPPQGPDLPPVRRLPGRPGRGAGAAAVDRPGPARRVLHPTGDLWLPQPTGWGSYAVNLQESDPDSFLSLYRQALGVRRSSTLFGHGSAAVTHTDQVLT